SQESRIPWSRSLGQLPANEPGGGLHMQISFPLPCQPLGRRKVGPERSRNELSLGWPISERGPWRRKKRPSIPCLPGCLHLVRDLVWGKQVVRVEPLNVIAPTQRKCFVPGGRRPLIPLRHHPNFTRLKLPHDRQSPVSRTVIDDNDLFVAPGLAKSRRDSSADPLL